MVHSTSRKNFWYSEGVGKKLEKQNLEISCTAAYEQLCSLVDEILVKRKGIMKMTYLLGKYTDSRTPLNQTQTTCLRNGSWIYQKLVHSVLFLPVLSILCSNTCWLSPFCYGMWRILPSWHKTVSQLSGFVMHLLDVCRWLFQQVCHPHRSFLFDKYVINQAAHLFMCSSVWNFNILPELLTYIHTAP